MTTGAVTAGTAPVMVSAAGLFWMLVAKVAVAAETSTVGTVTWKSTTTEPAAIEMIMTSSDVVEPPIAVVTDALNSVSKATRAEVPAEIAVRSMV